jgi:transcriptional regulator with XRE-family HTH domain
MTQAQLGGVAGVSQSMVSLVERGHLGTVALRTIRRMFAVVDARLEVTASWRGGGLDRLLDEAHAALIARSVPMLRAAGWDIAVEATYSVFGERGSIDVLAAHRAAGAALVQEMKSDMTSLEQLARKTDEKVRLVRTRLCEERFGFVPSVVGRVLVLPDTDAARRQVDRAASVIDVPFPKRTRVVRAWIRNPIGDLGGVLFVAVTNRRGASAEQRGRQRVRRSGRPTV